MELIKHFSSIVLKTHENIAKTLILGKTELYHLLQVLRCLLVVGLFGTYYLCVKRISFVEIMIVIQCFKISPYTNIHFNHDALISTNKGSKIHPW